MKSPLDARAAIAVVLGCTRGVPPPEAADPPPIAEGNVVEAAADPAPVGLAPLLPDGGWMQEIDDVHVAVPTGSTTKRPIVVGIHGAQDRPDWACAEWFGALGGRVFVACPHGTPYLDGRVWTSADAIVKGAEHALDVARKNFGPWIADGKALYGGWSQASSLAFAALKPEMFDAAVLVEIGHTPVDPRAVALAAKKVRGVAVVCATASCEKWAEGARAAMTQANAHYETWTAGHRGHVFDGEVSKKVSDAVAWVTAGDPRWRE
jgi:hypothetical protein